jgi:hypothetical protein
MRYSETDRLYAHFLQRHRLLITKLNYYPWKWDQIGFSFVVDKSKIGKKRDTVYSQEDANVSLKIVASELDKYIYNIDKEF